MQCDENQMTGERHVTGGKKQERNRQGSILAEAKCFIRSLSEEESEDSEVECHDLHREKNRPGVSGHIFTKRASGRS